MLLTITTTHQPATDLGYLLHKHPAKLQTFELSFGQAHVFYPEVTDERCTAALLLDIDPIQLFRQRASIGKSSFVLQQYVNDRPYVISSFLSVAIAEVYGTALAGNCKTKPELVETSLPLHAKLAVISSNGGEALIRQLFEPLGYTVSVTNHVLDVKFPEWGAGNLFTVELSAQTRLKDLLTHIYVLAPVLDDHKHYFVGEAEVDKLLARGAGWLQQHPLRELITERYLRHRWSLTRSALERLVAEDAPNLDEKEEAQTQQEISVEIHSGLNQQRLDAVVNILHQGVANRVLDLGCGEGKLLQRLMPDKQFTEVTGMDVSPRSLEKAEKRLQLDRMPDAQRQKLKLIQGSLLYRDTRLAGFDAAVLLEVIEHIEPSRLDVVEKVVFGHAKPGMVILTTPNREYNRLWPSLPAGQFRHPDHHFEWNRAEFQIWANRVAGVYGYSVSFYPIGQENHEAGAPDPDGGLYEMTITLPELSLIVLIGASGSGKSTFARRCFKPTEVISSDFCRALVADDENDQSATRQAFELLHTIAAKRLEFGRLAVIDATNTQADDRKSLVALAKEYHVVPVAMVFDLPESICQERNRQRQDRTIPGGAVHRQIEQVRRSMRGLQKEGFRYVYTFREPAEIDTVSIERQALWTNRQQEHGPFDIIGDLHGCCDELEQLLEKLGYQFRDEPSEGTYHRIYFHPGGRKSIFLGDLVDRGPRILDTVQLVYRMVKAGNALCLPGNHDNKVTRKLMGRDVQINGMEKTLAELDGMQASEERRMIPVLAEFFDGLISHYVLDDGKLVVAHAGMKESMMGRASGKVRDFALYGETTGETDEFGLPVRYNWAMEYRGKARVVYGHTPVVQPEWLNNTINLDTGCVFGGKLSALRYPELELVSVAAAQVYSEPVRPLAVSPQEQLTVQQQQDELLDIETVIGKRIIETQLMGRVTIPEGNSAAALEVMSRFIVNPKWLIYLPPTMSPPESTNQAGYLEHPTEAFGYYRKRGVRQVVCEQKHMGSRLVAVICKDDEVARWRFGIEGEGSGVLYTRTGRRFFADAGIENALIQQIQSALQRSGFWQEFATDWVCLDCELMPWSVKAQELLQTQYAVVGTAAQASLTETIAQLEQAGNNGLPVQTLLAKFQQRKEMIGKYVDAYRRYCWPVQSVDALRLAPFHVMATEGAVHVDKNHSWHMETIGRLVQSAPDSCLFSTAYHWIDLGNPDSEAEGIAWWQTITDAGQEGMVVKPLDFVARESNKLIQPAVKCRGREYLRIIYGPEYTTDEHLATLRQRSVALKRTLALKEFSLGIEALQRFVRKQPLRDVHECAFGVLALESEAVDPRL